MQIIWHFYVVPARKLDVCANDLPEFVAGCRLTLDLDWLARWLAAIDSSDTRVEDLVLEDRYASVIPLLRAETHAVVEAGSMAV